MSSIQVDMVGAGSSDIGASDAVASDAGTTAAAPQRTRGSRIKAATYRVLSRCAYWSPVLVALVLFAQVSFRGLRPAMAEARRLSSAESTLNERHGRAAAENREVAEHLAARQDPIFRERQRRLRVIEAPASPSAPSSSAASPSAVSPSAVSPSAVSPSAVSQAAHDDDT